MAKQRFINTPISDANYKRSNEIETYDKARLSHKSFSALLKCGETKAERQQAAQNVCNEIAKAYKIVAPKVLVTDKPRPKHGVAQTYGFYTTGAHKIIIYNTTAKTAKPIGIKTFADTLLHEFTHHYDQEYLGINSIHSAGFYKRISNLKGRITDTTISTNKSGSTKDIAEKVNSRMVKFTKADKTKLKLSLVTG